MTLKEKVEMVESEYVDSHHMGGVHGCPNNYSYLHDNAECGNCSGPSPELCRTCWEREYKPENFEDVDFRNNQYIDLLNQTKLLLDTNDGITTKYTLLTALVREVLRLQSSTSKKERSEIRQFILECSRLLFENEQDGE